MESTPRCSVRVEKVVEDMTIAEVAKKYGLTADTLRYYERIGLLPPIGRTAGGIRNYSQSDCNWVEYIKCMRGAGVSIETLVEYVALFHQGKETIPARKKLLLEQREQIVERIDELNAVLAKLDRKIEGYEDLMLKVEEELLSQTQAEE